MLDSLKRLSYRPEVLKPIQKLGLSSVLRRAYFQVAKPRNGILETEIAGVGVKFYIRTPGELRNLDPAGGAQQELPVLEELKSSLRAGDVFYDIGSNVGLYCAVAAKTVGEQGRVIAFEPMSEAFAHLQENVRLNGLTNVIMFRKAVGEISEQHVLHLGHGNADSSLVRPRGGKDDSTEMVEVIHGDDFIQEQGLAVPNMIKVDVEGFEYAVLRGLRRTLTDPACRMVFLEVHPYLLPNGVDADMILQVLKAAGFAQIKASPRKDTFHVIARR